MIFWINLTYRYSEKLGKWVRFGRIEFQGAVRSGQVQGDRKFWTVYWTVLGRFIRISDRKAKSFPNEEIMKRVDFSIFSS